MSDKVMGILMLAVFLFSLTRFRRIWAYRHNRVAYVVAQVWLSMMGIGYLLHSSLIQNCAWAILLIWSAMFWFGKLKAGNRGI